MQLEALRPLTAGILSERRAVHPFGLCGGGDAQPGLNLLIRAGGRTVNLGAKATVHLEAGDRLRILTPGGGGFGPEGADEAAAAALRKRRLGGDGHEGDGGPAAKRQAVALKGSVEEYRRAQETV
ncbi:hypothetical protein HYH02_005076 [Chlamydomonas schloesseri]|uniref:Hydantoinase B/oxoprolinase domain-containing protein n=1 Tax=Chlamydomonas schloesseri TaxID=2026947 RepID=A0A836B8H9_9CHLO|nr:hypothetical protein HYH02_005076 [Chlamydomonas schloesseri]|eukprot:KAG2450575.1 hypothetical protein HYH02_005076 [Chlamydomonas schloesseri]